jgi:hypothetical protein
LFELPLHLFPEGGFDSSILTIVFVGLIVMWWLTESVGFVFTGLVVPGYLASVLVIAPTTAVVVIVESLVTYGLVWLLSDAFARIDAWSLFFGRDRFFAFLLVSLFVRLVGELWLWPEAWAAWTSWSGYAPHLPGALTSVGLVLVPLAANMFWKVGVLRGTWQLGVPTALLYALTAYVILPLTNLRFSEFQVHYEDVAIDIVASPKAYVIMIVTAALAARANIRFGWDFGGILIPALLAIAWFDVTKAVFTIGEALLLAGVAAAVLQTPWMRRINLEGPRRIVFVFTLGFLLKYLVAWGVHFGAPHARTTDFFGFGYLLSSLLALKMIQRKSAAMVVVPSLVISVVGFVGGGLLVSLVSGADREPPREVVARTTQVHGELVGQMMRHVGFTRSAVGAQAGMTPESLARWEEAVSVLFSSTPPGIEQMKELGLVATEVSDGEFGRAVVVGERPSAFPHGRGIGLYVLRHGANGPIIAVPDANGDPTRALAALSLARRLGARALLFGAVARTPAGRVLDPRRSASSPYQLAFRRVHRHDVIELVWSDEPSVYIGTSLGDGFPLGTVTASLEDETVHWRDHPRFSLQRQMAEGAFVTVALDREETLRLAAEGGQDPPTIEAPLEASLERWLLDPSERVVAKSLVEFGDPLTPAAVETAFRGVLSPLVRLAQWPPAAWERRRVVRSAARIAEAVGLELERLRAGDECWWVVHEPPGQPPRGWGITAIRCDGGSPVALLNPFPLRETSTWRFSAKLADGIDARAIAFGAMMRGDSIDPRGDPLAQPALLLATHRAVLLEGTHPASAGVWTLEVRGLGVHRELGGDILISRETPVEAGAGSPDLRALQHRLADAGLRVEFDRGEPEWASLHGLPDAAMRYARETAGGRFAHLWLAADFRSRLSARPGPETVRWLAQSFDVPVVEEPAFDAAGPSSEAWMERRDEYVELAQRFAATRSPASLRALRRAMAETGGSPAVWKEPTNDRVWMVGPADTGVFGVRLQSARPDQHVTRFEPLRSIGAASFLLEEESP